MIEHTKTEEFIENIMKQMPILIYDFVRTNQKNWIICIHMIHKVTITTTNTTYNLIFHRSNTLLRGIYFKLDLHSVSIIIPNKSNGSFSHGLRYEAHVFHNFISQDINSFGSLIIKWSIRFYILSSGEYYG